MKISIIVPIFNCEDYLYTCIDSLVCQSYTDIEIILVDDGSSDRSASICDYYKEQDSRIKVIHKTNGGVSSARNAGLRICNGEYILFVDADDWVDEDAYERIIKYIDGNKLLYLWNIKKYVGDFIEEQPAICKRSSISEMTADLIGCEKKQNFYIRAIGGKVYSKKLIENLAFPENLYIGEDACFLLDCMKQIHNMNEIEVINDCWYNYRIISTSAVRKYKADLLYQSINQYQYLYAAVTEMGIYNYIDIRTAMTMFCWGVFVSLKENSLKIGKRSEDCLKWAEIVDAELKNTNLETWKLSKFHYLCWKFYRIVGEKWMQKIVGLYIKYKRKKD